MALDVATIPSTQTNISLFIDVETLLGLNTVMPLLKTLHSLIKFAQSRDVLCMIASPLSRVMCLIISQL